MADVCNQCAEEFERIANHWNQSNCSHPEITNQQKEIVTGLLMGDGCLPSRGSRNPKIRASMTSPNYLKYLDRGFGIFGNGVKMEKTAKESALENRRSGFRPNAKEENYSDVYLWYSMNHPELQEFESWYSSGEKVWPEDIELTPTVLKHWYLGDGHWNNGSTNNNISIAMTNESENTSKVSEMFKRAGLPSPSNYCFSSNNCQAQFTVDQSNELWEFMGEPLPDFEYKFPPEHR